MLEEHEGVMPFVTFVNFLCDLRGGRFFIFSKERDEMNDQEWKLIDRFKEPSSWAAIGAGVATIGVNLPPGMVQAVSYVGAAGCILAGVFLKEGSSQ
jgi:hypothetical protein